MEKSRACKGVEEWQEGEGRGASCNIRVMRVEATLKKLALKQRLEGGEGISIVIIWGRAVGTASARALR